MLDLGYATVKVAFAVAGGVRPCLDMQYLVGSRQLAFAVNV